MPVFHVGHIFRHLDTFDQQKLFCCGQNFFATEHIQRDFGPHQNAMLRGNEQVLIRKPIAQCAGPNANRTEFGVDAQINSIQFA